MVQLESGFPNHFRYLVIVTCIGKHQTEEYIEFSFFFIFKMNIRISRSAILGFDITTNEITIGMTLPIWADLDISLDGDG
jgi:hypothetical protein